jgi:uncharacterized protein (TIGR02147 family)
MGEKRINLSRPDIFQYHDHLSFLKDWLAFKKAGQPAFSLRRLALLAELATGYLPMVLSGQRQLSHKALSKLVPHLGLNPNEQNYLENLLTLSSANSHEVRVSAVERMQRFPAFQRNHPKDTQVYEYLTHWYYVAIRELALVQGFRPDPVWIQAQLRYQVPLAEIKAALEFLIVNGYLVLEPNGRVVHPEVSLECSGEVYRVALAKFHREILQLAGKSIEKTPSAKRSIQGHTCTLSEENFAKAKEIVDNAIQQIRALGQGEKQGDSVYHLEMALFPLTSGSGEEK